MRRINDHITMLELGSRDEWLQARGKRIGGSEASAVVGFNPYMSNTDLWSIKTGRREAEDISDKPYVRYGHDAEPLLRELFKLDFPDYKVGYVDNNLFLNSRYPWAHASLDGWLQDPEGRTGDPAEHAEGEVEGQDPGQLLPAGPSLHDGDGS